MKRVAERTAIGLVILASVASCGSARALAAADSACVRFSGTLAGERVGFTHRYALGGILPVTVCGFERGARYRIAVEGEGIERRVGAFSVAPSGEGAVAGIQFSAIARNIVVPGWGSVHADRWAAGAGDDVGLAATLVVLYGEEMKYRHLRSRLNVLEGRLAEAVTSEDRQRAQSAAHQTSRELNTQNDYRRRLLLLAGGIYAWQIVEPLLTDNPPGSEPSGGGDGMVIEGTGMSRAKAFAYSLVRPGRGQLYQGKKARSLLFSVATIAAGLADLHYQNEYEMAVDDYNVCIERFDATDVLSEKELLRSEADGLWNAVDSARDRRNAALGALAAVWCWNVVDTFFPAGSGESSGRRYSFDVDPRGASLAYRF
jgi:hypothetical protein